MKESVIKGMRRLRLEGWIVLGEDRTADHLETLASTEIFIFLVAGSDVMARTLRNAMAMGKPYMVADRGILPELI